MDVRTVKDLCQRLDELGTILELMEGEPVNVALHREASAALNQALSEIERLRSNADQHREAKLSLRLSVSDPTRTSTARHPMRCGMPLLRLNGFGRTLPTYTAPSSI